MKALSIKQPWAWAILRKGKDIENRKWKTNLRGYFWIHASKTIDENAPIDLRLEYLKASLKLDQATNLGGIIGSVELVDVVKKSDSKWFQGPVGFVLRNPHQINFTPHKGQLNFFEVMLSNEAQ